VDNRAPIKTDKDTLREGYRFILSEEDDVDSTWEKRLVKRYYDKLFKEYPFWWCVPYILFIKGTVYISSEIFCNMF
jgi:hypothetical protein